MIRIHKGTTIGFLLGFFILPIFFYGFYSNSSNNYESLLRLDVGFAMAILIGWLLQ
jgi:hypothetical protein